MCRRDQPRIYNPPGTAVDDTQAISEVPSDRTTTKVPRILVVWPARRHDQKQRAVCATKVWGWTRKRKEWENVPPARHCTRERTHIRCFSTLFDFEQTEANRHWHPAIEGFQRCFPPPDIETFTVNTSAFVFNLACAACACATIPDRESWAFCGPRSLALVSPRDQRSDAQDQTVLREHVPFCAGDANDPQEIRLACVCRKPFDTASGRTKNQACLTVFEWVSSKQRARVQRMQQTHEKHSHVQRWATTNSWGLGPNDGKPHSLGVDGVPHVSNEFEWRRPRERNTIRPIFPNSAQYSPIIWVRASSVLAKTRISSAQARQDTHNRPRGESRDQPASGWAQSDCRLPSAQSVVMTKTNGDSGAPWGTPRCTRILRWEEPHWRRRDTSLWDHHATNTAIHSKGTCFSNKAPITALCLILSNACLKSSCPTWTGEVHSLASSAALASAHLGNSSQDVTVSEHVPNSANHRKKHPNRQDRSAIFAKGTGAQHIHERPLPDDQTRKLHCNEMSTSQQEGHSQRDETKWGDHIYSAQARHNQTRLSLSLKLSLFHRAYDPHEEARECWERCSAKTRYSVPTTPPWAGRSSSLRADVELVKHLGELLCFTECHRVFSTLSKNASCGSRSNLVESATTSPCSHSAVGLSREN